MTTREGVTVCLDTDDEIITISMYFFHQVSFRVRVRVRVRVFNVTFNNVSVIF